MPQFSSGDRSRSRTNSHRWELWRPFEKGEKRRNLHFRTDFFVGLFLIGWLSASTRNLTERWLLSSNKQQQNTHGETPTLYQPSALWLTNTLCWVDYGLLRMQCRRQQSKDLFIFLSDRRYGYTEILQPDLPCLCSSTGLDTYCLTLGPQFPAL